MKLDDVLEMLESESEDERKARRKAVYFNLHEVDEKVYRQNRKHKHERDDEIRHNRLNKRQLSKHNRSKHEFIGEEF